MSFDQSDGAEAPLDPAAERLRRKLVRLLLVSGGIMLLGLITVFSVIVYKLRAGEAPAVAGLPTAERPLDAALAIPAGARLIDTDIEDGRLLLRLETAEGSTLLILADLTGRELARYRLAPQ
jgi:hypothetical protein